VSARASCSLAIAFALLAAAPVVEAQGANDQARMLFNMGAQAYDKGEFPAALQAFSQAYALAPRPGILFSMAQAHKKQFYLDRHPAHLQGAIKYYREYLQRVNEGGRRSDAAQALSELEPLAARSDMAAAPPEVKAETRLGVTSQTSGAVLTIDAGKPQEVPFLGVVAPGKHALRLTAAGYHDEAREVDVAPGNVTALDIPLREKAGHVSIVTPSGADVSIDGRFVTKTPVTSPLDVEPGRHVVSVTRNGYRAFSTEIELGRDESRAIQAPLETSGQRVASYVLIGAGLAAAGVGVGFAVASLKQQNAAQSFVAATNANTATCGAEATPAACPSLDAYNAARSQRDAFRLDAGIVFGGALVAVVAGAMLFAFDQPTVSSVSPRRSVEPRPSGPKAAPVEVVAVPVVAPGSYGGALTVRF
jgi:hypothetical protein